MRLVDADALKEDLTRFYTGEVTARALIDEQPTVGGWISVKDRLPPKDDTKVLTYGNPVTHWMPLPEPPKEVSGDG